MVTRQVKRKRRADDSSAPDHILIGVEKFRVEVFLVIIDKLTSALQARHKSYTETCDYFGFLTRLKSLSVAEICEASRNLQRKYSTDLQDVFEDELVQFIKFCDTTTDDLSPRNLMVLLRNNSKVLFQTWTLHSEFISLSLFQMPQEKDHFPSWALLRTD